MAETKPDPDRLIAQNRRASHDYSILETYEAGLVLVGPEVKSLRQGKASLAEAWAGIEDSQAYVHQMHIPPYVEANLANVDPVRKRKLLLHASEIEKLRRATEQKGLTLIPLKLYFSKGRAKLLIGLAKGKQTHDKRHAIAERESQREVERAKRGRERDR